MNGPEHYREAERLVTRATTSPELPGQAEDWFANRDADLAAAQVHATLALAAATISAAAHPNQSQVDYLGEWFRVIA